MSFTHTAQFVTAHRHFFLWNYGTTCILVVVLPFLAVQFDWWGLIPIAFAFVLLLASRLFLLLWATYQRLDVPASSILRKIEQNRLLNPQKDMLYLDLGYRYEISALAEQMIRGHFFLVDLYAPHLMPAPHLRQTRQHFPPLPHLPTLEFMYGKPDQLPLQDQSVHLVVLPYVWQEILQDGDRQILLKEISRVLAENGRLLLVTQCRTLMNWICLGATVGRLPKLRAIEKALQTAGFKSIEIANNLQLSHTIVATKPGIQAARQLPLNLFD